MQCYFRERRLSNSNEKKYISFTYTTWYNEFKNITGESAEAKERDERAEGKKDTTRQMRYILIVGRAIIQR